METCLVDSDKFDSVSLIEASARVECDEARRSKHEAGFGVGVSLRGMA